MNDFIKIAREEFSNKYKPACQILENITMRPMVSDKFTFYITTFPRMPYFLDTFEIFMFSSTREFWGMPIDGFLHEGLHFQFTHYWKDRPDIVDLDDSQFDYIKEALTVVLDEDLKPILSVPDKGYESQKEYRKLLSKYWKKYHNFNSLVDYAIQHLHQYYS